MSSQAGKVEIEAYVKAPAEKFYELFCDMVHHIPRTSPEIVQGVEIHEGEWGSEGSIIFWNYVHEGKRCVAKEVVEAIDRENKSITFKVIEGDLLENYKSFKFIVKVTTSSEGSVAHWIMEYEKLHDHIPDPHSLTPLANEIIKNIESHLSQG